MSVSLSASVLLDSLITPAGPWQAVDVLGVVGSTNAEAMRDPQAWRLVTADAQKTGRGRHARRWESPAGTSVALSMTVPLPDRPPDRGWLPLLAGLAVHDALADLGQGGMRVSLKWPNDVLVRADENAAWGKVCGILCEMLSDGLVVVGIGVNVTVPRTALPVQTATSLHLAGLDLAPSGAAGSDGTGPRERIVIAIARSFARIHQAWCRGGEALALVRGRYREVCGTIGVDVELHVPGDRIVRGRAVDVDHHGQLVVDGPEGRIPYAAGDVVHVRPSKGA